MKTRVETTTITVETRRNINSRRGELYAMSTKDNRWWVILLCFIFRRQLPYLSSYYVIIDEDLKHSTITISPITLSEYHDNQL